MPHLFSGTGRTTRQGLQDECDKSDKTLLLLEKIPTVEEVRDFCDGERALLVVDDLLNFKDVSHFSSFMLLHSHHEDISTIYCVQNAFYKNSKLDLGTLSRNTTMKIVLFQMADFLQYRLLSSRLFPEKKSFLTECLTVAKSKYNLNYVVCNTHSFSDIPRQNMVYTGIFKKERERFGGSPLFFDLGA